MLNTREKLTTLLCESDFMSYEKQTDYLIANGVTVQRWIPVTERLPEKGEYDWVLAQITLIPECIWGAPECAEYKNGVWRNMQGRPLNTKYEKVTHWMPLPAPPEEVSQ